MIGIARETLVLRREGILPSLALLIPTFALPCAPAGVVPRIRRTRHAPLPILSLLLSRVFGACLDTRLLSTRGTSTSELLRTL